ncbi:large-conductance mechanosensitive channel protein MscL [Xylocopilactobacillus apicola]|uniref:Large-conductance mechanosensitive channel n=1 Tax=Xylocopilactobacillus apicola TaxID=2932184 RepID=A0AAU9DAW7_9LACO|nr:large-conductance mechanosensitive channel protein MscL [Xylocopilactobacillus apicola]BDR58690.1 large-conductance mechanosensitive channel [Xylocopilactobacillus apicola]
MLKEFKNFIARGNIFDLAVGVIIGGAMTNLVSSLTKNLINPLLSMFVGKTDLGRLQLTIFGATYKYGDFLNDVINFLIIAFVVFLLLKAMRKVFPPKPATPSTEEELLTEIRDLLAKDDAK